MGIFREYVFYYSIKRQVSGARWNHLAQAILTDAHNIGFFMEKYGKYSLYDLLGARWRHMLQ